MSTVPNFKDLKRQPSVLATNKIFSAKVVSNDDPLKLQRLKIRVKKIHRGVVDADLPWALPSVHHLQGNNQVGSISIPVIGSTVIIEYVDDYTPIYRGEFNQDTNKIAELVNTDYPHCYGFIDRSGNKFFVNTETDEVSFTHVTGTKLQIDLAGKVTVLGATSLDVNATTDINVKATGAINFSCMAFNVDATTISLKAAGAMILAAASSSITATATVVLNAASFALNAAFNLVPAVVGWAVPPTPTPTPPAPVIVPPTPVVPRVRPTITGFTNQTDY